MPEEKTPNGKNGKPVGLVGRFIAAIIEGIQSLKSDLPAKAKEQVELLKKPTKTQVYTSIFRHKHDDTPRNRALGVLSNVFLHLHPAKINRDAVRYSYTWNGRHHLLSVHRPHLYRGIADVLLPSKQGAGLPRCAVPRARRALRQVIAQHAPLGSALDGDRSRVAYVPRIPHRLL